MFTNIFCIYMKPYFEQKEKNYIIRTFSQELNEDELKWHKDRENRVVVPVQETDWLFQRENCLPEPIRDEILIRQGEWHRILKGTGDLTVKIFKNAF